MTLTHDPKLDDPALDRALKSQAFYIGALGSRRTHAARLKRLRELGHQDNALSRIQGPVGLNIEAVTAPEIALSIIAEIVAVRRNAPLPPKACAMRFGSAPLDEARGAIMAHSQKIGERMIRKGSLLDDAAIEALREAGPGRGHLRPARSRRRARGHCRRPSCNAAGLAADRALPGGDRPGEPGRRGAGPAAGGRRADRPTELDR